ncbi:hypothetical protein ABW19_dt0209989 [Dactylella cylindrospora]|nr:hypothetical protein ABW19_dt0209989 [Dactylella cylindrospora]
MPAIRTLSSLPKRNTKNMSTSCGMTVSVATPSTNGKKGSAAVNWAPITLPTNSKARRAITQPAAKAGSSSTVSTPKKEVNIGPAHPENTFVIPKDSKVTDFQKKVYSLLLQIPPGRITTYAHLSAALNSSPRAVGTALPRNPYAPDVPCHRVIATTGYIGGFMGDWNETPSGVYVEKKLKLLKDEGIEFTKDGYLEDKSKIWKDFDV